MRTRLIGLAALALLGQPALAQLVLPGLIADHLVLQRERPVPIWGWADPGASVTVAFAGQQVATEADRTGAWSVELEPMEASTDPRSLRVSSNGEVILVEDVLVGEVWLCSGQSNMVWSVGGSQQAERFASEARDGRLRMFTIPNTAAHEPREDCEGDWVVSSPETVSGFSAVGYHFGRLLMEQLDVPVGLINSSWGGSTVEAWVSRPVLDTIDAAGPTLEAYDHQRDVEAMDVRLFTGDELDESEWTPIDLPVLIEDAGYDTDGIVWFRRTVTVPRAWVGRAMTLSLGAIDDNDATYVNGVRVGATNNWQKPREYDIPAGVTDEETLTLAIRVEDTGGAGGFSGTPEQMTLGVAGQSEELPLHGPWLMRIISERPSGPAQHRPANLYNGMIHPARRAAVRGAIFYQGENNAIAPRGEEYVHIFPAMIEQWRAAFGDADMPFYFVQLPLFTNNEPNTIWRYPVVRQAQLETMRRVPNTGMAVTLDLGEANDIHPRNKHDVGDRLARWALTETYGLRGIVTSGPIIRDASFAGPEVTVSFDLYGSTLDAPDGALQGFEIAGPDGAFRAAEASIRGQEVVLRAPGVDRATAARYAWKNNPSDANLRNAIGMPASPFLVRAD